MLSVSLSRIARPDFLFLSPEMDEELRKRNTDCVYFLASPLTCKKGVECEYRHSEIARLNPRECWYWFAGSCLNPSCAFRHPPVDEPLKKVQPAGALTELSSESAPQHYQCTASANKSFVPCYFYFNGFCNKGDRCSFLHGPDDGAPAGKSLKTLSAVSDAPFLENKTSAGSDAISPPIETHPNPSEAASSRAVEIQIIPNEDVHLSCLGNVKDQSASPDILASECKEASAVRSGKLPLGKGLLQTQSLVCTDQSSEEQVDHIEREEWLESSPGFDVLVDYRSENMGCEDDPEYLLAIDRDGRELNGHLSGYDYGDPIEYDPVYPDAGILYEQVGLDSYVQFDNEQRSDYMIKVPGCSTGEMLDPIFPRKRKLLPVDLAIDGGRDVDLRDHLRKRRVMDSRRVTRSSRRNNSSWQIDRSQEKSRRYGMRRLRGRLTTETDSNCLGSLSKNGTPLNGVKPQGWFQQSHSNRSRQHYKDKWQSKQHLRSSEVPRKPVSKKRRSTEKSVMFTSPKTLPQIKEEKRKAAGSGNFSGKSGYSTTDISEEFRGPKPLSEILDDKKKLGSVTDVNNDSR